VASVNAAITTRPKIKENIRTGWSLKNTAPFAINTLCIKKPGSGIAN
jgi:hypothetical protein